MLQYHPKNPFRPIDWRWQWARLLREKKMRLSGSKNNDELVVMAYQFQKRLVKCVDDVGRWYLMEQYPDLYAAHLIYKRGEDEDRHPLRYVVEARLLAGQPTFEIASLLGISTNTVDIYEQLFFNVSERLQQTDFIMTCVLGPSVHAGLADRDYDLLWKLFGYLYGPVILDAMIHTTARKYRPTSITEVDAALADDTRSSLQRKVAIIARTFVVNPFSQTELLNTYARFVELEKESSNGKSQDLIMQNIQIMMDKLPWQVGKGKVAENTQISHYELGAAELRTDELLTMSVDNKPIELPKELKFPEASDEEPAK